MATGTVTFSASTYAPGSPGPDRAILTITRWAGLTPPEGARDRYETITAGANLVVELEESTDEFCYRVVVSTPATLGDLVRYVSVPPGASNFEALPDVDPTTFETIPLDGSARAIFAAKSTQTTVEEGRLSPDGLAADYAGLDEGGRVADSQLPERLSEAELKSTYVLVRTADGEPLPANKILVFTLTPDQSDIDDVRVYDSIEEVGA